MKNLLDEQVEKQESLIRKKRASLERRRVQRNRMDQFLADENNIFGDEEEEKNDDSAQEILPLVSVKSTVEDEETKENQAEMTYVAKMAKGDASATLGRLERRKNQILRTRESSTSSVESSGDVESKSNGDRSSTLDLLRISVFENVNCITHIICIFQYHSNSKQPSNYTLEYILEH